MLIFCFNEIRPAVDRCVSWNSFVYQEVKRLFVSCEKDIIPMLLASWDNIFFFNYTICRIKVECYSITTSGVSSMTLSPCLMQMAVTLPSFSASMLLAIFMASNTTTVSPAFTSSPT